MPWEIKLITVKPKDYYRVHVSGVNSEHPTPYVFGVYSFSITEVLA